MSRPPTVQDVLDGVIPRSETARDPLWFRRQLSPAHRRLTRAGEHDLLALAEMVHDALELVPQLPCCPAANGYSLCLQVATVLHQRGVRAPEPGAR